MTRRRRRASWLLALSVLLLPGPAAWGHATLVRTDPAARSTVRVAPRRAQLWFSERLEPAYSTVSVWKGEARVDGAGVAVAGPDGHSLTVALPPLERGAYLVKYRVLSVDGHVVEGTYSFTITDRAPAR